MPLDQILQRGGDEEVFLAQPQFAPRRALIVRIQELADRLGARLLGAGAKIVAGIEDVEFQGIGRARQPTIGVSYATAWTVSAGCQIARTRPLASVMDSTVPPK
jgi:hypothetical protein